MGGGKGEGEGGVLGFHGEHVVERELGDCYMPDSFGEVHVVLVVLVLLLGWNSLEEELVFKSRVRLLDLHPKEIQV